MNLTEKQIALRAVGERIRNIRLLKNMTIKQVAAHLQITTQAYGNIENGKTDTSISRLVELASLFQIPVTRLITLDQYSSIIDHSEMFALATMIEKNGWSNKTKTSGVYETSSHSRRSFQNSGDFSLPPLARKIFFKKEKYFNLIVSFERNAGGHEVPPGLKPQSSRSH